MVHIATITRRVRKLIIDSFIESGHAPNIAEVGAALDLSRQEVTEAYRVLKKNDVFAVERGTENIRMLAPFSNLPTPYKVSVDGDQRWFGPCAPESLGISFMFPGCRVRIETYCRDCGDEIHVEMQDGNLLSQHPGNLLVHLGVPVARWFDDWPYA